VRRLVVLALALVVACGSFGVRPQAIALAFKAGDTYSYKLHVNLDLVIGSQGFSVPFKLDLTANDKVTVKSVDSSGVADVTLDLTDITVKSTSFSTDGSHAAKSETVELRIAPDGRILTVNGEAAATGAMPDFTGTGSGLLSAILPDGEVRIGDTWTKDFDAKNPHGSGSVHVTTQNKYLRDEDAGGVKTAVVESKITSILDLVLDSSTQAIPSLPAAGAAPTRLKSLTVTGTVTTDMTSWIDTSARRLVKTHSTGTADATVTIDAASPSASPAFNGPITFKGTQSVQIDPA